MAKVTLKDVAREAGVSAMSVSKALNNKPGISDECRAHILEIANRMNYAPNLIAKSLRMDETKTIGVVLSDSSEMVMSKILRGIQDGATAKGYSVIVANTDHKPDRERQAIITLVSKQIDGLILVAPSLCSDQDVRYLQQFGVPFVLLMRKNDNLNVDTVINDNYLGGYETVRHLIQEGCRRFQILALEQLQSSVEREKGYFQAFRDFKIPETAFSIRYVKPFIPAGYDAAEQLIQAGTRFDALVCGCDTVAVGAMEALIERKVRIPEDIKLIGYDGIELGKYLRVPLSTMAQPLYEIGSNGIEILIDRIHYPDMAVRKVVLKSELIVRDSTRAR